MLKNHVHILASLKAIAGKYENCNFALFLKQGFYECQKINMGNFSAQCNRLPPLPINGEKNCVYVCFINKKQLKIVKSEDVTVLNLPF